MTQSAIRTSTDVSSASSEPASHKRMPQLGLRTLLLATACIAAWGSTWMNRQQIEQLKQRVTSLRLLTRELVVQDRNLLAIVRQEPRSYDQELWHLHVPHDSLALHLATQDIPPKRMQVLTKQMSQATSVPLTSGYHIVELKSELEGDQWITQVLVDGNSLISVAEPKEWNLRQGQSGVGNFDKQANLPADQPAVLFHRIFIERNGRSQGTLPTEPSNGIALWIGDLPSPPLSSLAPSAVKTEARNP